MQKVVIIKSTVDSNTKVIEMEFPELNKYLEEGFKVVKFEQISPSQSINTVFFTFVLSDK